MKISCIQMNMKLGAVEENFLTAEKLIREAAENRPDVIVLPEMWNVGFFPRENLEEMCDEECSEVKKRIGVLAEELGVNIVAGSVANMRGEKVYNTVCVFDRGGKCVAEYNKVHLFTPMLEQKFFTPGDSVNIFDIDGVLCGIMICYDLRFPELSRTLALSGAEVLFIVSQWPKERIAHLQVLTAARAIENQSFVVCCNSCGEAEKTKYGGSSLIIDPWGKVLASAGEEQEIILAKCEISEVEDIRKKINVFSDRRPELYKI